MSRPKGPEKQKLGVNISAEARDWIRATALEKYGSAYSMGRVVEDLVDAYVSSGDAVQTWQERVHRFEKGREEMERVARDYASEAKALRRQLERIRALHPGLVRRIAGGASSWNRGSSGGAVSLSQESVARSQVHIPDEWIERARETPCVEGCGGLMDPGGLMRGLQRCPGCRAG